MEWERDSSHSIVSGQYAISKMVVGGVAAYLLWLGKGLLTTHVFKTADDAKAAAEDHAKEAA
jgi:hypothetical protein